MAGKYSRFRECNIKHASSFRLLDKSEMKLLFSKDTIYLHRGEERFYQLGESIIQGLGQGDITRIINIRDSQKLRIEASNWLAKHLAIYMLKPQRYAHDPSNVIAPALHLFALRLGRVRAGHKLPFKSTYQLKKSEFGTLVAKLQDNDWLWDYAQRWRDNHLKRVRLKCCYPL